MSRTARPATSSRDRGSVLLEIAIAGLITAGLVGSLAALISSSYSSSVSLTRRSETAARTRTLMERLGAVASAAAPTGSCSNRTDPTGATNLANCRRLADNDTVVVSGTATGLCTVSRAYVGATTVTSAPVLAAHDRLCIELNSDAQLVITRTAVVQSDYVDPSWTNGVTSTERLLDNVVAGDPDAVAAGTAVAAFTYFDASGALLTPSTGSPASLSAAQRANVRLVRLSVTVATGNSKTLDPLEVDLVVGGGRFVQERRWQGQ